MAIGLPFSYLVDFPPTALLPVATQPRGERKNAGGMGVDASIPTY